MGNVGNCYDNAVSESFVHTLKTVCNNGVQLISFEFTEKLSFDYIEVFYNRKRKHSTLGYMSPCHLLCNAWYNHSGFYIDAAGRDHLGVPPIGQLRKGANVARSFWSGSVK